MFVYIIEVDQKVNIKTPFKMVDRQVENSAKLMINTSTYENGWVVTIKQYADHFEIISNKELVLDSDGSYIIKED